MAALKPESAVVFILHGDDAYAMAQKSLAFSLSLGDPSMVDLNTARLDGRSASDEEIRMAASSMPFLADRRLVILTNPLARLTSPSARERFTALLDSLPPTTDFLMQIEDTYRNKKVGGEWQVVWDVLKDSHWLMKWAAATSQKVAVEEYRLPTGAGMRAWIQQKAVEMGGAFHPAAAQSLADQINNDTRVAALEIEKLLTYVDFSRQVEEDDVLLLTSTTHQTNVFEMVDALGQGDERKALRLLQDLLEQEDPFAVFGMIVRQFRLLLQTREVLDEGGGLDTVQKELGTARFIAEKMASQARRFSLQRLENIYHRLLDVDEAVKTSQMDFDLALELLVSEINR
jgi:DNA polymerase-3 subunit delta